jgi:hypothetical protein
MNLLAELPDGMQLALGQAVILVTCGDKRLSVSTFPPATGTSRQHLALRGAARALLGGQCVDPNLYRSMTMVFLGRLLGAGKHAPYNMVLVWSALTWIALEQFRRRGGRVYLHQC